MIPYSAGGPPCRGRTCSGESGDELAPPTAAATATAIALRQRLRNARIALANSLGQGDVGVEAKEVLHKDAGELHLKKIGVPDTWAIVYKKFG